MKITTIITLLTFGSLFLPVLLVILAGFRRHHGLFGATMAVSVMCMLGALLLSILANGFHLIPASIPALVS